MRELLFEAKHLDSGEWVQGYYVCVGGERHYILTGKIVIERCMAGFENHRVDPATVRQYTGLTDKNGTKIFEGAILKVAINETAKDEKGNQYYTGNKKFVYWSVEWVNFMNYLGWRVYGTDRRFNTNLSYSLLVNCPAEVIGNIYDNPELLKGGAADEK